MVSQGECEIKMSRIWCWIVGLVKGVGGGGINGESCTWTDEFHSLMWYSKRGLV